MMAGGLGDWQRSCGVMRVGSPGLHPTGTTVSTATWVTCQLGEYVTLIMSGPRIHMSVWTNAT